LFASDMAEGVQDLDAFEPQGRSDLERERVRF
jgi:hypothetical protein